MKIHACGQLLADQCRLSSIVPPSGTPLAGNAKTILGMAHAYEKDGSTFYANGDLVNAHAAYYYGFGWLHFGLVSGFLFQQGYPKPACPFAGPYERLPRSLLEQLTEKTYRYERLLRTACDSVKPAPQPMTGSHFYALRILMVATSYAKGGHACLGSGTDEKEAALARFSYGHGWLDAGVRSGLFVITGNNDLFTV
ncbi:MAG: DUF357 domain-containing protein [Methanoregula sp.]|nr:DUF357 domain-containing protein [Methanoregula sp.]